MAQVRAKPGKEDLLRAATLPLIDLVRGDPPRTWSISSRKTAPSRAISSSTRATQADFDAHNAMPYVKDWFAKLPELAGGGVEVMHMAVLGKPKN